MRIRGRAIPVRDHKETAGGGGGRSTTFMEAATKRTKRPSELPYSHHHHWPPIEEFIYSDPERREVLKHRYN